ncbi:MAG: helix-turn-helix domain-containing protein [Provencibacterium sp.]|jgi:AraC-like DNA-binding protein|nr:helix-turn-helix domain-containing protein [Provencibacterium sp.]
MKLSPLWEKIAGLRGRQPVKKSVFFSFVFSYIAVLLVPLLCSIGIFQNTRKGVQREMLQTNQAILTQSAQMLDNAVKNTGTFCLELSMKENISSLLYIRQPLDDSHRYQVSEAIRKELRSLSPPRYFSDYFIYYNYGGFALSPAARYTPEITYQTYFASSACSFEQWLGLMGERHFQQVLDLGDSLLYLQTLPYTGVQAPANIAILLDKGRLLSLLDAIEWVQRGMFFVVDEMGEVVLTNRTLEDWEALSLKPSGDGMLSGRYEGKRVFASSRLSSENDWHYYLVMDNHYLSTANASMGAIFWAWLLFAASLGVLLAFLFSRRNYRPIQGVLRTLKGTQAIEGNVNELVLIDASVKKMIHLNADIRRQLDIQDDYVRQNFLSRLLRGRVDLASLDEGTLEKNKLIFSQDSFLVALFHVDDCSGYFSDMSDKNGEYPLDSMDYSLILLLRELISQQYTGYVCEVNGLIACAVNFSAAQAEAVVQQLSDSIVFVEQTLFIRLTLAVSGIHHALVGLHEAYEEAYRTLESSLFSGRARIFRYSPPEEPAGYGYTAELEQSLAANLRAGSIGRVREILDEIFQTGLEEAPPSFELARCFLYNVAATFIRVIEGMGLQSEQLSARQIAGQIGKLRSAQQMRDYLSKTAEEICRRANEGKESHNTVLLERILRYLWQNYSDSGLNNEQIAREMEISSAYLSRFFKQQTGDGLLSTISRIRIEEAKKLLLQEGRRPLSEIGQAVGFENVATFIRIFKKYEGITPGRYASLSVAPEAASSLPGSAVFPAAKDEADSAKGLAGQPGGE